jgi:hypothetical protein
MLAEAVQALVDCRAKIKRLEGELELAKAEKKRLEEIDLPPIFLQARTGSFTDSDTGVVASKSLFAYARLAKDGPQRLRLLKWLEDVGEQDAIKAKLSAEWSRGEIEIARKAYEQIAKDQSAKVDFREDVHWAQLQSIILERVKRGEIVPLDEIGATVGDHVTITREPIRGI